jgi:hypothetical protein
MVIINNIRFIESFDYVYFYNIKFELRFNDKYNLHGCWLDTYEYKKNEWPSLVDWARDYK